MTNMETLNVKSVTVLNLSNKEKNFQQLKELIILVRFLKLVVRRFVN